MKRGIRLFFGMGILILLVSIWGLVTTNWNEIGKISEELGFSMLWNYIVQCSLGITEIAVFSRSASDNRVKKLYDRLSRHVHLDVKPVIRFLPYVTEKSVGIQLLPIFDKEKVTNFSINPLFLGTILWSVFENELGEELRKEMKDFFLGVAEEMGKQT